VDTIILPEPTEVYPERSFESAIVDVVRNLLTATSQSVIVPRFGLDIAIFMAAAGGSRTALIEVKSFNGQRQGGIGFGNNRGEGPQVNLLLCGLEQMQILDKHVRWAFVDARQPHGSARFALITASQACKAVMGEVRSGKQNNFSVARLSPYWATWSTFCKDLSIFLLSKT
jgi:hypothetical protein